MSMRAAGARGRNSRAVSMPSSASRSVMPGEGCGKIACTSPVWRAMISVSVSSRGTNVTWRVALRPGRRRALPDTESGRLHAWIERIKASIRAKVEHPFRVIKRQFGHTKVRYRGLAKNTAQLVTLFALSNLWMCRKRLAAGG